MTSFKAIHLSTDNKVALVDVTLNKFADVVHGDTTYTNAIYSELYSLHYNDSLFCPKNEGVRLLFDRYFLGYKSHFCYIHAPITGDAILVKRHDSMAVSANDQNLEFVTQMIELYKTQDKRCMLL